MSMKKTAFLFPGQGAQFPGMGKDFYEAADTARELFEKASAVTGLDLKEICFTKNDKLDQTEYTQIAMITTELAMWKCAEECGLKADVCAGLSLGEYAALAAAGVMDLEDIFRIVRKRGIYMQNAYPNGGAMTAVLGADTKTVEEICERTSSATGEVVSVANYNCPGQLVITGTVIAVNKAAEDCQSVGAKRCIPLNVSGPFHSALLKDAARLLSEELEIINVSDPKIPYLTNVTAEPVIKANEVCPLLSAQICSPVKWQQSIERMLADGVERFIEIGPGKTLSGFMKRISGEAEMLHIGSIEELEKLR